MRELRLEVNLDIVDNELSDEAVINMVRQLLEFFNHIQAKPKVKVQAIQKS